MSVRIISGKFNGRVILAPDSARPTLSRYRQSLFDILESFDASREFFKNKIILDCFAGSGALGLEALSRGALYAYFIDKDKNAVGTINLNIKKLKVENDSTVFFSDATKIKNISEKNSDVVFIDPPYGKVSIKQTIEHLVSVGWISDKTLIVTEEDTTKIEDICMCREIARKEQGKTLFRFFFYEK